MINIIGQLIGYASILMNVLSYQQSDYKKIMTFQVLASVCSLLHYGLIFAWTGLVLNVIGLLRSIAFRNRSEKSDKSYTWLFWLFLLLNFGSGAVTYVNIYSIFAILSSSLRVVYLWNKNPKIIRLLSIPTSLLWIIYCISCGSIPGIISELIVVGSVIIAIYKNKEKSQA